MADIITTLHPENDSNIDLYPNVKKDNIPNKSIDRNKLDDDVNSLLDSINELHPSGTDTSTHILAFNEDRGIYIGTDTGHWYYWNGSQYVDGGVFLSIGNVVTHDGNQLKDENDNDLYPNIDIDGYYDYDDFFNGTNCHFWI